jgi:trans-aconitate 2-methyltransferase
LTPQATPNPENRAATTEWNARAYHAVSEPQFDWGKRILSTLALNGDEVAMDGGCGTGRLTSLLAERLPNGFVVAVDRSENMVRVATATLAPLRANAGVALADLSELPFRQTLDVVFSTATFHWVPDHDVLFASLFASLRPGGRLVAQCGGIGNLERLHSRARELTHSRELSSLFSDFRETRNYADAETTRRRLRRAGFDDIETDIEPAPVTFPSAEAFAAFASAVVLRQILAHIPDEHLRTSFVDRITEIAGADRPAYELDYKRLNIRARKP